MLEHRKEESKGKQKKITGDYKKVVFPLQTS